MKHVLTDVQAQYREKILAAGFRFAVISEEEAEDGIGFVGNNYMKGSMAFAFEDALEDIGELENYRRDRSAAIKARRAIKPKIDWDKDPDPSYRSPDYDM